MTFPMAKKTPPQLTKPKHKSPKEKKRKRKEKNVKNNKNTQLPEYHNNPNKITKNTQKKKKKKLTLITSPIQKTPNTQLTLIAQAKIQVQEPSPKKKK